MGRLQTTTQQQSAVQKTEQAYLQNQEMPFSSGNMGMLSPIMTPALMREMATVYSQMAMAQARPRNFAEVQNRLINICARESLAAVSTYAYAKGGTDVSGPSIRLAEAIASAYGNFKYGFEVTERTNGNSKVRAYAFDMETNTQAERIYDVPHWRDTKGGGYQIKESREIYELEANMSARRMRACILEIIPKDVVDFALEECNKTLATKLDLTPERINAMVKSFQDFGVTKTMIENFIQRKVETIHKSQFIRLRSIYGSLKDGMAAPADFFDMAAVETPAKPVEAPKQENTPAEKKNEPVAPVAQPETEPAGPEAFEDAPFDDEAPMLDGMSNEEEEAF